MPNTGRKCYEELCLVDDNGNFILDSGGQRICKPNDPSDPDYVPCVADPDCEEPVTLTCGVSACTFPWDNAFVQDLGYSPGFLKVIPFTINATGMHEMALGIEVDPQWRDNDYYELTIYQGTDPRADWLTGYRASMFFSADTTIGSFPGFCQVKVPFYADENISPTMYAVLRYIPAEEHSYLNAGIRAGFASTCPSTPVTDPLGVCSYTVDTQNPAYDGIGHTITTQAACNNVWDGATTSLPSEVYSVNDSLDDIFSNHGMRAIALYDFSMAFGSASGVIGTADTVSPWNSCYDPSTASGNAASPTSGFVTRVYMPMYMNPTGGSLTQPPSTSSFGRPIPIFTNNNSSSPMSVRDIVPSSLNGVYYAHRPNTSGGATPYAVHVNNGQAFFYDISANVCS